MGAPPWMDVEFFETLLRENGADADVAVTSFDVCPAVGKGENYVSVLHRVTVHLTEDGKPGERHLIVKSLPESEMMVKFVKEGGIFEKETSMYAETLPALRRLERDAGVEPTDLACTSYRTSRPFTIIMDDLARDGFKMAPRRDGLDLDHARLALQGLARLHALSRGLLAVDPRAFDLYVEGLYVAEKRDLCQQFLGPNIGGLADKVDAWEGFEHFGDRLRQVEWVDKAIALFALPDTKGFGVLNHGDCWVNNMMFRHSDDGVVEQVKFVDFQIARYSSLAFDLQYFKYSSLPEAVRTEHWDALLDAYHAAFVEASTDIGQEVGFTRDELTEEVDSKALFGLLTACTILPIVLTAPEDAPDMSQFTDYDSYLNMEDKSMFTKPLDGDRFKRLMKVNLEHFAALGVL